MRIGQWRFRSIVWTGWLAVMAVFCVAAEAGEGVSGVWRGEMELGEDDPAQKISFTIRQKADGFAGTISVPGDNLNMQIEKGEFDDGYLSLSGISPITLPDGSTPKVRFVYSGFLDDAGKVWEGDWHLESVETGLPAGAGGAFKATKTGGKPATPGPEEKDGPWTPAEGVSMAGPWQGTYVTGMKGDERTGTLAVELQAVDGGYRGKGKAVDGDGTAIPPMTFASGKMNGKKFEVAGTMKVVSDDGEEFPATVSLSGQVVGKAWRGNLLVKATIEGEETPVISGTFKLERGEAVPAKAGGLLGGMGNQIKTGQ